LQLLKAKIEQEAKFLQRKEELVSGNQLKPLKQAI